MDGCSICYVFFFNDTATTEIYTLSLHDALPIWAWVCYSWLTNNAVREEEATPARLVVLAAMAAMLVASLAVPDALDRKSTRLNSSHANISYAVFCLKKKKINYFCFLYNTSMYTT